MRSRTKDDWGNFLFFGTPMPEADALIIARPVGFETVGMFWDIVTPRTAGKAYINWIQDNYVSKIISKNGKKIEVK